MNTKDYTLILVAKHQAHTTLFTWHNPTTENQKEDQLQEKMFCVPVGYMEAEGW